MIHCLSFTWYGRAIRILLTIFLLLLIQGAFGFHAAADERIRFYIAPNGNDENTGSIKRPFLSIIRAKQAIREIKSKPGADIVVTLRGGSYRLEQPMIFTPEDIGQDGGTLTFTAHPGETPIILGSRRITGFQPAGDGLWSVTIPEANDGRWNFEQLYINGRRAVRARTPNNHYFYMNGAPVEGIDPATNQFGYLNDCAFLAEGKDIGELFTLPTEALRRVVVVGYHSWDISRHYISSVDAKRGAVFLTGHYPPKFYSHTTKERYYLENYRAALDEPGEWFLDRDGTLIYRPRQGEDMKTAIVEAPVIESFIHFKGESNDRPVSNITLKGLSFAYAHYSLPPLGQWSPQAASKIQAAILADHATNIKLLDCTIEHTGAYAVWFRNGCSRNVVQKCYFNDLGAGGIRVGQTGAVQDVKFLTDRTVIDNNIIRNGGHIWPDAVGILIGQSGDNQVTHNDISGLPYTGISVGWKWGYGRVPSVRNTIRFNHVHHLGRDILYDMGAIYTLGEAPGTVISDNVIHDLENEDGFGMSGIYNDNSSSFILMERNLVYNILNGYAYQLTSGKENVLRNNILVSEKGNLFNLAYFYDQEDHLSVRVEKNIAYGKWFRPFSGKKIGARAIFRNNLYWNPSKTSADADAAEKTFTARQKDGYDRDAVFEDPGFEDPAGVNFDFKTDSAMNKIGFKPFNYKLAGVYGSMDWVNKAKEVQFTPYQRRPLIPWTFFDDFENTPIGSVPGRLSLSVENKGDSILVSDETSAGGKNSLKITKVTGLQYPFNPHFYFNPRQIRGKAKLSFDIKVEQPSHIICEWRQYPGNPYYVGPKLAVKNCVLSSQGKVLMPVPCGEWFHIEMSAGQGIGADGTWDLTVTLPASLPRVFNRLKTGSPDARTTNWIGFVSGGNDSWAYYIDNLRMSNDNGNELFGGFVMRLKDH